MFIKNITLIKFKEIYFEKISYTIVQRFHNKKYDFNGIN